MHFAAQMSTRSIGVTASVLLWTALARPADAAEPAPPGSAPAAAPVAAAAEPAESSPRRAMPDYDGRGNFEADADHAALWIPRVVLGPLYVVHQYVLRKPIGALVTIAERDRWINTISQLFTFGPDQQFMLIPT